MARVIDLQEAQENLEQLIDDLNAGESFIIAKDGLGKVEVGALTEEEIQAYAGQEDAR